MDIVKEHEALIKLDRGSGAVTALADEYCSRGLWAEAVRVCRRNPAFHPEQLRGRVLLGWALKELGEWDEAERVLREAAMEVQRNALLFSLLAEMAEREGNIKRAELFLDICQNLRAAALEQATAPEAEAEAESTGAERALEAAPFLASLLKRFETKPVKTEGACTLFTAEDRRRLTWILKSRKL